MRKRYFYSMGVTWNSYFQTWHWLLLERQKMDDGNDLDFLCWIGDEAIKLRGFLCLCVSILPNRWAWCWLASNFQLNGNDIFFFMIMFCYLPAPSLPPLTRPCAHSHKDTLFSRSDVDDIFRREAKVRRRWDLLSIAESCSGFQISCPGWFNNWISKGGFLLFLDVIPSTFCWSNICFMISFMICMDLNFLAAPEWLSDAKHGPMDELLSFLLWRKQFFWHYFFHYFFLHWSLV